MNYESTRERELLSHIKTFVLVFTCYSSSPLKPQMPGTMPCAHFVVQPNHLPFAHEQDFQILSHLINFGLSLLNI